MQSAVAVMGGCCPPVVNPAFSQEWCSATWTVGHVDLTSKHTARLLVPTGYKRTMINSNISVCLPQSCRYSDVSCFVWPEPDSTQITNMDIPTVLSKHKFNYSCCESVPVWAVVVSLIWFNSSSCMLHAVMKAICPPAASMQHWQC